MDISDFVGKAERLRALGVEVSQNDRVVARWRAEGECRRNIYSAAKSFTACAVGIARREGLLSLDERLTDAFSDEMPPVVSDNLSKATVRDLLTMCLGQKDAHLMGDQRPFYQDDDWVRMALAQPFDYAPGTRFVYNNVGPYLAGVLVQRRAGCDLVSYLTPRLFAPLGIKNVMWETDPRGLTFGAGGLFLTISELHRFGLLCLHEGEWDGRQLVPREWIRECAGPQDDPGYGYLFWRGRFDSFRADGKYCQLAIVLPGKAAVVTVVAECRDAKEMMSAVYSDICSRL